jgi:hypothetical protein
MDLYRLMMYRETLLRTRRLALQELDRKIKKIHQPLKKDIAAQFSATNPEKPGTRR